MSLISGNMVDEQYRPGYYHEEPALTPTFLDDLPTLAFKTCKKELAYGVSLPICDGLYTGIAGMSQPIFRYTFPIMHLTRPTVNRGKKLHHRIGTPIQVLIEANVTNGQGLTDRYDDNNPGLSMKSLIRRGHFKSLCARDYFVQQFEDHLNSWDQPDAWKCHHNRNYLHACALHIIDHQPERADTQPDVEQTTIDERLEQPVA
jgi:hypothetical protein